MRKGFLIYEEMRNYYPIYGEAVSHIWLCNCSILNFPIYEETLIYFFISVATVSSMTARSAAVEGTKTVSVWFAYISRNPRFFFKLKSAVYISHNPRLLFSNQKLQCIFGQYWLSPFVLFLSPLLIAYQINIPAFTEMRMKNWNIRWRVSIVDRKVAFEITDINNVIWYYPDVGILYPPDVLDAVRVFLSSL